MALFGRDSLITSYQALPFVPELAATTLRVARRAARARGATTSATRSPGKILHELRFGELTAFGERPHSPYYGSADATPLFLVLLDEYERWTGDAELVRELEPNARAALAWIDELRRPRRRRLRRVRSAATPRPASRTSAGRTPGTRSCSPTARWPSRRSRDLRDPGLRLRRQAARCARLAREVWDDAALAERLERAGRRAARRVQRRTSGCPSAATTRSRSTATSGRSTALTSNIGHLLWSGHRRRRARRRGRRAPARRAAVLRLGRADDGRRARAATTRSSYHNGTVWPHDNSLIAAGLRRYGYRRGRRPHRRRDARRRAALRAPAARGLRRLRRERSPTFPVEYPTACSPQAWAAGAPLLLLTMLLGPDARRRRAARPAPARGVRRRRAHRLRGRWGRADITANGAGQIIAFTGLTARARRSQRRARSSHCAHDR